MSEKIEIYQVDAFTDQPFTGNPAAVCLLNQFPADGWMQSMAAEMNLSETAFVCPADHGFRLRWFTPTTEVDLCGHATLAASHALWESGRLPIDQTALFQTASGELSACRRGNLIELDFPSEPPVPHDPPPELLAAISCPPVFIGQNRMDYLVEVASVEEVETIQINMQQLSTLPVRGLIVTAKCEQPDFDFVSRFFAPAVGVNEDPVTGSAHCCLAPYWGNKLGLDRMRACQASSRGGVVEMRIVPNRVVLGGNARTIFRGVLAIDSRESTTSSNAGQN